MTNEDMSQDQRDKFGMTPADWARLDAMSDDDIHAAVRSDPDAAPIRADESTGKTHRRFSKVVRHKLKLSYEAFAEAYGIPVETLQAWDRGTLELTSAEMAYLKLIEREPELAKRIQPNVAAE